MWQDADDEIEDDEYPDEDDSGDTAPCPHCGELVYDDSERCPECGLYPSREDAPAKRPWYVTVGVLLCLGVVCYWILYFF